MEKKGFATRTKQVMLYGAHPEWFLTTKEYYNRIVSFYYQLLIAQKELLTLSNQKLLRRLEIMTVGEKKKGKPAEFPIPYEKVPLYFRRSAINTAIRMARSFASRYENWEKSGGKGEPSTAKKFNAAPVYYQGMYRNFTRQSIELKLWNGDKWEWVDCPYDHRKWRWQENEEILSPTLKVTKKGTMLHIPVVKYAPDIRRIEERMREETFFCAVSFPNQDDLAVAVIMDLEGNCRETRFFGHGKEYAAEKNYVLGKLKKAKISMKDSSKSLKGYPSYQEKLHNLSERYAHLTSREIVDYCLKTNCRVIAVPHYTETIPGKQTGFLQTTGYDWIGRRIISYVRYKAFEEGILTAGVNPAHTADRCHICGEEISRYNEGYAPSKRFYGGRQYVCKNGHKGNAAFNTAMNVGITFLAKYRE